ncbi:MAG: PilZ domain-containing protein [Betaproteobacteria bacterium]|nr:PilZ domain-containing protein [Betaproteobacteria bacterium]
MTPLELTEHADHRGERRYRHLLPVRIGSLELVTANVSLHGMQIVCPIMRFNRIKADARSGQLSAQVDLPRGAPFDATLSVRYCSQYGDEVLIGVRLALADPNAQAQWAAYIDGLSSGVRLTPERAAPS